jgi:integrase
VLVHGQPRLRVSLGTDDRGVAEARARAVWSAMTTPKSDRVSDLWAAYVVDRKAEGVPTSDHKRCWKHLEPHFGYKLGDQISKDDCRTYLLSRKAAPSTIRQELTLLRACLNMRYGRGQSRIILPPPSAPRERFLTKEEVRTLLEHVTAPHVELFIVLAIVTGARMQAILEAKWDQVDFLTKTINYLPLGRHQTSKRRVTVPLNDRAWVLILKAQAIAQSDYVIEYEGKGIKHIKWAIRRAAERSGVPCSPHVFRHTAGVWMAQADVPMQKIAQYLGHSTTAVTEKVYARYSPSFMKDAADALDW